MGINKTFREFCIQIKYFSLKDIWSNSIVKCYILIGSFNSRLKCVTRSKKIKSV